MKKKGAGMVMTIMLVAVCGWVAIVAFVIKPGLVAGAGLSVCGGAAIGLAIIYLMSKWWFKRIPRRTFCGLCQCEVEGSWEEHVESQQHQDNLTDPGKTGGAKVRHEMEFEEAMKRAREHKLNGV